MEDRSSAVACLKCTRPWFPGRDGFEQLGNPARILGQSLNLVKTDRAEQASKNRSDSNFRQAFFSEKDAFFTCGCDSNRYIKKPLSFR
ncbi:MAG: hypothetical protein C4530_03060 [Desulfobacteraceae bacterium]|nr:MAG: hypothetical protein C4530_03060 [Desulfobacteraceae bacterium]